MLSMKFVLKNNEKKININNNNYIIKQDFTENYEKISDLYFHSASFNKDIYLGTTNSNSKSIYNLIYNDEYVVFFKYLYNSDFSKKILSILNINKNQLIKGNQNELIKYYDNEIKNKHMKMRNCFIN